MKKRKKSRIEYGDFQTPSILASEICKLLIDLEVEPLSVIEPTCGKGNLLLAALEHFPSLVGAIGIDINPQYIEQLKETLLRSSYSISTKLQIADFFTVDWEDLLKPLLEPILIIGNPPWVTNATLSTLGGSNLPEKTNFKKLPGLSAKTGKSNFDISEWMLFKMLKLGNLKQVTLAILCKTSVARKVLVSAWTANFNIESASIYSIDALKAFGASVDACLFVCSMSSKVQCKTCDVYEALSLDSYRTTFGFQDNQLIANIGYYNRWQHLQGKTYYKWRSGVKHDAAKVMELRSMDGQYINKLGGVFELENVYLYPMLKSSEIANSDQPTPSRWMLITQQQIGDDTTVIQENAPQTWEYLHYYADILDKRKSSVYRNYPRFSVFGVGKYTFSLWKVAISAFYKQLKFVVIGPNYEKATVLDDTCYFIPCQSRDEALFISELLNSEIAQQFFEAFIFWDAKRPITIEILKKLDLVALAREFGKEEEMLDFIYSNSMVDVPCEQLGIWT
ncbi:MAG: SAM-dependent DNA methyltransferase [Anaerolineae bacterium]|nr:SAM-dependent DNA methyltransferase [Anaerolineae bacterium]